MFKDKNAHHIYPFLGKKRNRNNFFVSANTETETERGFTFSAKPIFGQNGRNSAENRNRICFGCTLELVKFILNHVTRRKNEWKPFGHLSLFNEFGPFFVLCLLYFVVRQFLFSSVVTDITEKTSIYVYTTK